jgi:beta-xylosidase
MLSVITVLLSTLQLPNTRLPVDQHGNPLITGESSVLHHEGYYYFYFKDWGGCQGVDCCSSTDGCASCCFKDNDPCVYTTNHSVKVYRTDLRHWELLGTALPPASRASGVVFRPCVVFNRLSNKFVMWYEDRHPDQKGYAVAVADSPQGPFVTVSNSTALHGQGRSDNSGDFNILVDDDGSAYHVRDGFVIERLTPDYLRGSGDYALVHPAHPSEGPVMFKRHGLYYLLTGSSCCACIGGSSIDVHVSSHPLGPYTYSGDVGSSPQRYDPHSPTNFVTRAQGSTVFSVASNETTFVWVGNQWVSSALPGHPRNHDLLYFAKLVFSANGTIGQLEWEDAATIEV